MIDRIYRIILFITLGIIEFLATTTSVHIKVIENIWDKANHFSAFFVLYILLSLSYRNMTIYIKIILLLIFGLQIEIVQSFIDGRFFSLLDIFADFIGIIIGIFILRYIKKI